jgi:hypothetical protein
VERFGIAQLKFHDVVGLLVIGSDSAISGVDFEVFGSGAAILDALIHR